MRFVFIASVNARSLQLLSSANSDEYISSSGSQVENLDNPLFRTCRFFSYEVFASHIPKRVRVDPA